MKPVAAPSVSGNTDQEHFDNAIRKMFTVPKPMVLTQEAEQFAENRRKRAKTKEPA